MTSLKNFILAVATAAFCLGASACSATAPATDNGLSSVKFSQISRFFTASKPAFIYLCNSEATLCNKQTAEIGQLSSRYPDMTFWRCDDPAEQAIAVLIIPGKMMEFWHNDPNKTDAAGIAQLLEQAENQLHYKQKTEGP